MSDKFLNSLISSLPKPLSLSFSEVLGADELDSLSTRIASDLIKVSPFCLWLKGDLGSGKTSFCQSLFPNLGVSKDALIQSPTYSVMSEYQIKTSEWLAHLDLYRLDVGVNLLDFGLHDLRNYRGFVIEWPERITDYDYLAPTHILDIKMSGLKRKYDFWSSLK